VLLQEEVKIPALSTSKLNVTAFTLRPLYTREGDPKLVEGCESKTRFNGDNMLAPGGT
jgi:hypothetical protein